MEGGCKGLGRGGTGGLLSQGGDEGVEEDGVESATGSIHGSFDYMDDFAKV